MMSWLGYSFTNNLEGIQQKLTEWGVSSFESLNNQQNTIQARLSHSVQLKETGSQSLEEHGNLGVWEYNY